jgi:hypothetical protein
MTKFFYALWVTALVSSIALQASPREMTTTQIATFVGTGCNAARFYSGNCATGQCTQIWWNYAGGTNNTLSCTTGTGFTLCTNANCGDDTAPVGCVSCCGS